MYHLRPSHRFELLTQNTIYIWFQVHVSVQNVRNRLDHDKRCCVICDWFNVMQHPSRRSHIDQNGHSIAVIVIKSIKWSIRWRATSKRNAAKSKSSNANDAHSGLFIDLNCNVMWPTSIKRKNTIRINVPSAILHIHGGNIWRTTWNANILIDYRQPFVCARMTMTTIWTIYIIYERKHLERGLSLVLLFCCNKYLIIYIPDWNKEILCDINFTRVFLFIWPQIKDEL